MQCIEKASQLIDAGEDPNNGIAKAAKDLGVRPGEVGLVVHAYNTGRTARQRSEGEDLFAKAAEFPMADTAVVLQIMYPDNVKTAAAVVHDTTVHPVYSMSPKPFQERRAGREKAANNVDWRTINGQPITAPPAYPREPKEEMRRAAGAVERAKVAAEEHRRKMSAAFDIMGQQFLELTEYFRRPDAHPLPVVKEAVMLLHGDQGELLFDQIVKVTPELKKLANHRVGDSLLLAGRSKLPPVSSLDCTQAPFPTVASFLTAIDTYQQEKKAFVQSKAELEKISEEKLRPFAVPAASQSVLGPSSIDGEKRAFLDPWSTLATAGIWSSLQTPKLQQSPDDTNKEVRKQVQQLEDPEHENKIRAISTQAMLHDLMSSDPVISAHDPDDVMSAYNDIVQLAPRAADQRMLMQTMLRKNLEQGRLDQFDMSQMLDMDDKLNRRDSFANQGAGGDGSVL